MPQIRAREIRKVERRFEQTIPGVGVRLTKGARDWVDDRGFDKEFGARPLRRLVESEIITPLGNLKSMGIIGPYDVIVAQPSEDNARLDFVTSRLTRARAAEHLAKIVEYAATTSDDAAAQVDKITAAVRSVITNLPPASAIGQSLRVAIERAEDAASTGERVGVLRESVDYALSQCPRLPKKTSSRNCARSC